MCLINPKGMNKQAIHRLHEKDVWFTLVEPGFQSH